MTIVAVGLSYYGSRNIVFCCGCHGVTALQHHYDILSNNFPIFVPKLLHQGIL